MTSWEHSLEAHFVLSEAGCATLYIVALGSLAFNICAAWQPTLQKKLYGLRLERCNEWFMFWGLCCILVFALGPTSFHGCTNKAGTGTM
jgi:hypothetical protein